MDMTGERRIPAPRQAVWDALNDPDVLKNSIPGCQTLEKLSDNQMQATAAVRVGPISARFNGKVQLSDIQPPEGYTISGEGQGGVAGFAKGSAKVHLTEEGAATLLAYQVNAQVGGKLAQIGGRLIDATARQMADTFFDRFSQQVEARLPQSVAQEAEAEIRAGETMAEPVAVATHAVDSAVSLWSLVPKEPLGFPMAAWIGGGVFAVIVVLMLGSML